MRPLLPLLTAVLTLLNRVYRNTQLWRAKRIAGYEKKWTVIGPNTIIDTTQPLNVVRSTVGTGDTIDAALRDLAARVIYGARPTLLVCLAVVVLRLLLSNLLAWGVVWMRPEELTVMMISAELSNTRFR